MHARGLVILLAACGPPTPAPTTPDAPAPTPTPTPCPASPDGEPLDYNTVAIGGRYFVDVAQQDGVWAPAAHVRMPFHHATMLAWDNPEAFADLGPAAGRVRVTLVVTSREIQQVPGRHEWLATVTARVVGVCAPD